MSIKKFIGLFLSVGTCAYATGSNTLNGPTFLFSAANPRPAAIYHAFDMPIISSPGTAGATFTGASTDILNSAKLQDLANKGYTHIQLPPFQYCSPAQDGTKPKLGPSDKQYPDVWFLGYSNYICVLDSNYATTASGLEATGGTDPKKYGTTATDGTTAIGYYLGSPRYGTMADLKALITAAQGYALGIIMDVQFNQVSFDLAGTGSQSSAITNPSVLHPMTIPSGGSTPTLSSINFPSGFFNAYQGEPNWDIPSQAQTTWKFGPDLNTGHTKVQEMIVNYLKLLKDLSVAGLRVDGLKQIPISDWNAILSQARTAGVTFNYGYGEAFNVTVPTLSPYVAIMPVLDFALQDVVGNVFANDASVSTLVAPASLGNTQSAVTLSAGHDFYPNISTGGFHKFYTTPKSVHTHTDTPANLPNACAACTFNRNDLANMIDSQLAIAYMLSRRDGSPLIIRFDDDKDVYDVSFNPKGKNIIKNALAFRKAMDANMAPHEYMVALNSDVLLIARQFGFALINKGGRSRTIPLNDLSIPPPSSPAYVPNNLYIPDTTYNSATNAGGSYYQDVSDAGIKYTKSSTAFVSITGGSSLILPSRNAKFFVLQYPTGLSARSVVFQVNNATTSLGQQMGVVGSHPLLGNGAIRPDFLNIMMNQGASPALANLWRTIPISFPAGSTVSPYTVPYKFAVINSDGTIAAQEGTSTSLTISSTGTGGSEAHSYSGGGGGGSSTVSFRVGSAYTAWGQNVYVIGSSTELGSWNTANAVIMSPTSYPTWTKTVIFNNPSFPIAYKYIKKSGTSVTWLSGSDKTIPGTTSVNDTWS
ncbi:carbohydrate-binding module family 20 domain-containing protein [Candidatus Finniella inopinata]|uniref:CBM20 domain-containing protein n=1 Tax=Candidatus Finniella inopinata TaxID=1696036 RepID=A0A4Q7DH23_9PROT|nr:carbohydrate-binding module family 20 domain-containing protein [Candidatus Finniella inopinata]RZI45409.1 hypothetical protein EQU50_07235 [Candidatus Finniella inopinata]